MIAERSRARTRLPHMPRPRRRWRWLVAVPVLALVLGVGWLWLRSSSLVAIQQVQITGLSGPDVPQLRSSLTAAAERMTTLSVDMPALRHAAAPYPDVTSLRVSTHFPHGITIDVGEQVPLATVQAVDRREAVDAAGMLLALGPNRMARLPQIPLRVPSAGPRLVAPGARAALQVLAAAPYALLNHISSATSSSAHGVIVQLRSGPQLFFGGATMLREKWTAALAVLGNASSRDASYIDVSDPQRPAAGAGGGPQAAAAAAAAAATVPAQRGG